MKQTVALILGMLVFAVPALAQQPGPHAGHGPGMSMGAGKGMQGEGMMCGRGGGCCCGGGMMGGGMMGHGGPMGMGLTPVLMNNADELKLTDEQLGKLHRIHNKRMAEAAELMKTARASRGDVADTAADPAADEAAIRAAAKVHADSFGKLVDLALAERKEVLAVLTADQKTKLKALKPAAN